MTYVSPFGKPEGLAERLEQWATSLAIDKRYPWYGTGIIDDLRLASATIAGGPVPRLPLGEARAEVFATLASAPGANRLPAPAVPEIEEWEKALAPTMEYDL